MVELGTTLLPSPPRLNLHSALNSFGTYKMLTLQPTLQFFFNFFSSFFVVNFSDSKQNLCEPSWNNFYFYSYFLVLQVFMGQEMLSFVTFYICHIIYFQLSLIHSTIFYCFKCYFLTLLAAASL